MRHHHPHAHSHGLIEPSIKRSREGLDAVTRSLLVLGRDRRAQALVFVASGSVALLADLIHNVGDAATAIPLGIAFLLRSARAERVAGSPSCSRSSPRPASPATRRSCGCSSRARPMQLAAVARPARRFAGNWLAARIRTGAGRRLDSPALVADGDHARADAYVSLAVVASAAVVALGLEVADPLIGLAITFVILRITLGSWRTVR